MVVSLFIYHKNQHLNMIFHTTLDIVQKKYYDIKRRKFQK